MKKFFVLFLLCFGALVPAQQNGAQGGQKLLLQNNDLGEKSIEETLPAGHFLHLRANNTYQLLEDIEGLGLSFLSPELIPANMKKIFTQPNPLLTLIGFKALGRPLNKQSIGEVTGLAIDQALSVTLYAGKKPEFIVSLPLSSHHQFSQILPGLLQARSVKEIADDGVIIKSMNPDLPAELYVACSKNYAYICSSASLLSAIHDQAQAKMISSKIIKKSLAQYAHDDLMLVLDAKQLKSFTAAMEKMDHIPLRMLLKLRREINKALTPQARLRLRFQLGIDDTELALNYLEAFSTAAYESAFTYLFQRIENFHGLALSMNLGTEQQTVRIATFSDDIKAADYPAPLAMKKITQLVSSLPGDRNDFTIESQSAPIKKDLFTLMFMTNLKAKFAQYKLDKKYFSYLNNYVQSKKAVQPLSTVVPWTVSFPYEQEVSVPVTASEVMKAMSQSLQFASKLRLLGTADESLLLKHYREEASSITQNHAAWSQLLAQFEREKPFLQQSSRMFSAVDRGLKVITLENVYKSTSGFFGYDEHELINRKFLHYKAIGNYLMVDQGNAADWLRNNSRLTFRPLAPAVQNLLKQVPAEAHVIRVSRKLQKLDGFLRGAAQLEKNLNSEIEAYLLKINTAKDVDLALETTEIPLSIMALYDDGIGGNFKALLPLNLHYPRPLVMENLMPLFEEYLSNKDMYGGLLTYTVARNGQCEQTLIQRTDAVASLVRSSVSAFHRLHIGKQRPDRALKIFMRKFSHPNDGASSRNLQLLYNPNWEWLKNM